MVQLEVELVSGNICLHINMSAWLKMYKINQIMDFN